MYPGHVLFFISLKPPHMFKVFQVGILEGGEAHPRPNIFIFSERYDSGPKSLGEEHNQKGQYGSKNTNFPN
jgi:hypothetical protein